MTTFKLKLNTDMIEAYMGVNEAGWIVLATEANAISFTELEAKPGLLQIASGELAGRWLSVSATAYLGVWSDIKAATTWEFTGGKLRSGYNDQFVAVYGTRDGYVYAWDKYDICKVSKVIDVTSAAAGAALDLASLASVPAEPVFSDDQHRDELMPA